MESRKLFCLTLLPEGSWFGDYEIFMNMKSQYTYVATTDMSREDHAVCADPVEDKRVMLFNIPKDKFRVLLNEFPNANSFFFSRAIMRRNTFRNIELIYNNRYGVDKKFDHIRNAVLDRKLT